MVRTKIGRAVGAWVALGGGAALAADATPPSVSGFGGFAPVNVAGPARTVGYSADKGTFTLTDGGGSEAASGFTATPQAIGSFLASFAYTVPGGSGNTTGNADGITLAFQNDPRGTRALGGAGGGLGYGGVGAIAPSGAFELNLYGAQGITFGDGGNVSGSFDQTYSYLHVSGGSPIRVSLAYAGGGMSVTLFDTSSRRSYTTAYANLDLPTLVGGPTAYVGFTAATGGVTATQAVSNFTFTPTANATPFTPVAVTGFDQRLVVPASARANPSGAITATLNDGTVKQSSTFYEQGFNQANPTLGLPAGGGVVTSGVDGAHQFQLMPYTQSEAVLLDASHFNAGLTPAAPAAYGALSLLAASANGNSLVNVTVAYANGTSQRFADLVIPDWYGAGALAVSADGRYTPSNGVFESQNSGSPGLFQIDLPLSDTVDAVTYVALQFDLFTPGSNNTHAAVFALSGSAVPEPATIAVFAVATATALGRRRPTRNVRTPNA